MVHAGTEASKALEARLRAVEDRLEIYNLIAGHPPSADTGADYYAETVYMEDGVFDRGANLSGAKGNKAIAAILTSEGHQAAIAGGLAHFTGLPYVELDGDHASVHPSLRTPTGDPIHVRMRAEKCVAVAEAGRLSTS